MNWLEDELSKSSGRFLCGDNVTAADTMMHTTAQIIVEMGLGTQGKRWSRVEKWLGDCQETESYKRAIKKAEQ